MISTNVPDMENEQTRIVITVQARKRWTEMLNDLVPNQNKIVVFTMATQLKSG